MTTDWPTIDPSADLFGGDLFGDELLDMYNPSVARKFVCEVSEQFNFFFFQKSKFSAFAN